MKTFRVLIQKEILRASLWTLAGFVSLMTFFDLLDELKSVGQPAIANPGRVYGMRDIAIDLALGIPTHAYTLMPICLLIGGVFVMSRLAQNSEFTVLRIGGLGPGLALRSLAMTGVIMGVATFVVGDYVVPVMERQQALLKSQFLGKISSGRTGAWLKERTEQGGVAVNIGALDATGNPESIRIFEFNVQGRLIQETQAASAEIAEDGVWVLRQAKRVVFPESDAAGQVQDTTVDQLRWPSSLTASMVS
ncbi:MAG: hypothetical protein RL357_1765, partial [Pseudomonadota bacterium]